MLKIVDKKSFIALNCSYYKFFNRGDNLENQQKLYSIQQFCKILEIHRATFYAWVKRGFINPIRVGGKQMVTQEELNRILTEGNRE